MIEPIPSEPAATFPQPVAPPVVTFDMICKNPRVRTFIAKSDEALALIGYTEHGERHVRRVANGAQMILEKLKHSQRTCELAAIAGYMHDIGNAVNRNLHAQTGAVIALRILDEYKMPDDEITTVIGAIGNHHEADGWAISEVAAALILADKSDVHRSRVRNPDTLSFDIHDRVNYSVEKSFLDVDAERQRITLDLSIDTSISGVMEYFEIFMTRMLASVKAAKFLGTSFGLMVNNTRLF
ncbi:MAG TPA: HD domain-containing protein [Chthoniobacteraceae bacterium]|nr:HD domain-containing protein [Chthoniobacteraceae bacterium]